MPKYLFIYRKPPTPAAPPPSAEEMQQIFEQWNTWKEDFKKQVVDVGDGLQDQGMVFQGGETTDGPFAETKEIVAGYSIVETETAAEAIEVAKACPMNFLPGSSIEIRETMGF